MAAAAALRYLRQLPDRRVTPESADLSALSGLDEPFPSAPMEPAEVIKLMDHLGTPATVATSGPRFFGFVMGGTLPAALAASWLAAAWDQVASSWTASPIGAAVEKLALRWLLEALGLPPQCGAGFVTGGTMANFTALAAARHALLAREGWDVEARGLAGSPPITVLVSEEAHPSVRKSLGLLGFGRHTPISLPVDQQGRIRTDSIPDHSGPTIICAQAGNVNTGAVDPLSDICSKVAGTGAWVHVDGAFGLWAAASPGRADLIKGIDRADSWATDAHKWLNVPYDSGVAIVRDPEPLQAAMAVNASYLAVDPDRQPRDYTPELSRRARGVEIWAALKSLGREGLEDLVERCCRHAKRFADVLSAHGYRVLNDVVLNQVLVDFGGREATDQVARALQDDGTCWCGTTDWQGHHAMRISVSSWETSDADVDRCLDVMLRVASEARTSPHERGRL